MILTSVLIIHFSLHCSTKPNAARPSSTLLLKIQNDNHLHPAVAQNARHVGDVPARGQDDRDQEPRPERAVLLPEQALREPARAQEQRPAAPLLRRAPRARQPQPAAAREAPLRQAGCGYTTDTQSADVA